jgi:hypothetical protein
VPVHQWLQQKRLKMSRSNEQLDKAANWLAMKTSQHPAMLLQSSYDSAILV